MPIEQAKEVAKAVVEAGGSVASFWQWLISGIGAAGMGIWAHVTGRLKALEANSITAKILEAHVDDEDKKFDVLFMQHAKLIERVTVIGEAVARIEGKLNK